MRVALLVVVLGTASCATQSLEGVTWEEMPDHDGTMECPDAIRFESDRYVYMNDCYAPGQDGIVETGQYTFRDGKLRLHSREISSVGSRLGSDADPLVAIVGSAGNGRYLLTAGKTQVAFQER